MKNFLLWISLVIISSCSGLQNKIDTSDDGHYYRRDMKVEINDVEYEGVGVLPDVTKYKIKAEFKDDGDLVKIITCNGVEVIEQAWKPRFFGSVSKDKMKYDLKLGNPVEYDQFCAIEIEAYSHSGLHTYAYFVRQNPQLKLPATLYCDRKTMHEIGVSLCHVNHESIEEILFPEKTNIRTKCPYKRVADNRFQFYPPKGRCVYRFFGESGREHLLLTAGWDSIKLKAK